MIALEDLTGATEQQVIDHLAEKYSGDGQYSYPTPEQIQDAKAMLSKFDILIAYESVGSYGCDSSAFFLLKNKETGKLFEIHGSHCSCYEFEGQLDPEETTVEALKYRVKNAGGVFSTGGYDDNSKTNIEVVNDFINKL